MRNKQSFKHHFWIWFYQANNICSLKVECAETNFNMHHVCTYQFNILINPLESLIRDDSCPFSCMLRTPPACLQLIKEYLLNSSFPSTKQPTSNKSNVWCRRISQKSHIKSLLYPWTKTMTNNTVTWWYRKTVIVQLLLIAVDNVFLVIIKLLPKIRLLGTGVVVNTNFGINASTPHYHAIPMLC